MKFDILTLFPEMLEVPLSTSMMKKAKEKGVVDINIHNLRNWTADKHKSVDDRPYGGGKGMVLMIEPIYNALKELKNKNSRVILLSPQGTIFVQKKAKELLKYKHIILIAGHYEGFDERIRENLIDEEISIGKYVLTGGEIPAMVVTDSVVRLLPGVLDSEAVENESFSKTSDKSKHKELLDYPSYTRPETFKGWSVPEVLISGDHKKIENWRRKKSIEKSSK